MREFRLRVFRDEGLNLVVISLIIAYLLAPGTDGEEAAECFHINKRLLQLLDKVFPFPFSPLFLRDIPVEDIGHVRSPAVVHGDRDDGHIDRLPVPAEPPGLQAQAHSVHNGLESRPRLLSSLLRDGHFDDVASDHFLL